MGGSIGFAGEWGPVGFGVTGDPVGFEDTGSPTGWGSVVSATGQRYWAALWGPLTPSPQEQRCQGREGSAMEAACGDGGHDGGGHDSHGGDHDGGGHDGPHHHHHHHHHHHQQQHHGSHPGLLHVDFPEITSALLANLNQQRVEGKLCDISIHVQGRVFRAHRAVLAASSPYFHDQVLLKNMTSIVLPNVMDPSAFETVLGSAYTGRLSMAPEEIVNFLTVGSVLQMWHIVDKCTELLKEGRVAVGLAAAVGSSSSSVGPSSLGSSSSSLGSLSMGPSSLGVGPSSSMGPSSLGMGSSSVGPSSLGSSSMGPSSSVGPSSMAVGPLSSVGPTSLGMGSTPSSVGPSSLAVGPSSSSVVPSSSSLRSHSSRTSDNQSPSSSNYFSPRETPEEPPRAPQPRDGAASKSSADALEPEEEEEEEEEEPTRRPLYVRPSIVPHKQWVYVKQEWLQEDLVLTCEEDEDPLPPRPPKTEEEEDEQVDFCESSEDFPSPYGGLEEPPEPPGLPPRPLLPMDMQGNQILVFPPQPAAEHGAVRLTAAPDGNKIFMCHCGKAFSHKSMRDRHVNMHLNLRPFACPVCSKKFKMKHHLTEHMKTHTGLKPYQCDVCAKKFMWRDSFVRHKGHCERRHRAAAQPHGLQPPGTPRKGGGEWAEAQREAAFGGGKA